MPETIDESRRRLLGIVAVGLAATEFGSTGAASATPRATVPLGPHKSGASASFAPLKQIEAGVLNVGYAEAGPADGAPVILLHGWPYDIHSYVDVTPQLAGKGYRVIVPYLRGYGSTRFLSDETPRNRHRSVVAVVICHLMDALKTDAFYVAAIGSRANSGKRRERLKLFDVTDAQLARLHGPAGIFIGSRTPPEIAVSIAAEMTAARNGVLLPAALDITQTKDASENLQLCPALANAA